MLKLKRYHKDIWYPEWADNSINEFIKSLSGYRLILSYHATGKYRNFSRQYRKLIREILETINLEEHKDSIFEFYTNNENVVKKACFRIQTDVESDIILVISSTGKVVTIFLNKNFDPHISLDRDLYEQNILSPQEIS